MRGDRLREMRDARGFSQEELARLTDVSSGHQIWKYETNRQDPSSETVAKFATVLECTSDYLLGLVDKPDEFLSGEEITTTERRLLGAFRRGDLKELMKIAISGKGGPQGDD